MTESDFVASVRHGGIIQRAAPHISAKTARVRLFSYVENDFAYMRGFDKIFHLEFSAKIFDGVDLVFVQPQPHIHGDCHDLVFLGQKTPHRGENIKQSHAVFSARKPHGDFISVLYHSVIFRGSSRLGKQFLKFHILSV